MEMDNGRLFCANGLVANHTRFRPWKHADYPNVRIGLSLGLAVLFVVSFVLTRIAPTGPECDAGDHYPLLCFECTGNIPRVHG